SKQYGLSRADPSPSGRPGHGHGHPRRSRATTIAGGPGLWCHTCVFRLLLRSEFRRRGWSWLAVVVIGGLAGAFVLTAAAARPARHRPHPTRHTSNPRTASP